MQPHILTLPHAKDVISTTLDDGRPGIWIRWTRRRVWAPTPPWRWTGSGYPHISYYDSTNGDLRYAYQDASGGHILIIDSEGVVGRNTSLTVDGSGYPHIAYNDLTEGRFDVRLPGRFRLVFKEGRVVLLT